MVVMFDVTAPVEREHAMAKREATPAQFDWKAVLTSDEDGFRALLQTVVQEVLEAEMTEALQAEKNERTASRLGHRSGYYDRKLVTRIGVLELRVPQDRAGRFSTELFERYQRSEKALVAALAEMYVQGVSTRKVKTITEELCGHGFSASAISDATARLDGMLTAFAERRLSEASRSSWRDFLAGLKARGLCGVELVVSDDHQGLKAAIREVLPEAVWQRCYVHFLRNALDYVPRKVDDDCLMELRWFYDRRDLAEVRRDLAAWLAKWQAKYPKLTSWVEENLEETLTYYRLPLAHHKHMKSTNMLERLNQELKRRTLVVRIFPNAASCLRLVRALAAETHEGWLEATRYLNMEHLKERKKEALRAIAA